MSLFLQTLILRGLLFREQEHRQEHMNWGPAEARRQAVLKTASQFTGAGELKKRRLETCIRRYEQHESF
jgi:hypothetical protein